MKRRKEIKDYCEPWEKEKAVQHNLPLPKTSKEGKMFRVIVKHKEEKTK